MLFRYSENDPATEIAQTGWSKALETGIEIIDSQHARYFEFVNDLLATASNTHSTNSELIERLDFLIRYAMEHFSTEQNIMKKEGYPHYQQHFEEHMKFLQHVGALRNQISEDGHNEKLIREVRFFTLDWFVKHIQTADMKVVEFLKQNSAKQIDF